MRKNTTLLMLFCLSLFSVAVAQETAPAVAEDAQAPAPAQTIAEAYAQAAPAPAPQTVSEPTEIHVGARVGLGFSQFRGHPALVTPSGTHKVKLQPSLAASAGAIAQIGITPMISVAPELQWSLYRASAELEGQNKGSVNNKSGSYHYDGRAALMGVYMHSVELPILARFHFDNLYGEIGPQVGFNIYSRIYKNANYYDPDINRFAFGVAAGGGIELGGLLLGARLHFGFLDYSKDAEGVPWNFEFNVGKFFF